VDVLWIDEGTQGYFEVRTAGYGSNTSVALGTPPGNSAAAVLGLSGGTSTAGQDVAGTIDGFAAEGSGRLLKATNAASDANGLWLDVSLAPSEIGGGVDATVTVTKGVGRLVDDLLDYLTDPVDGYVKSKEDRFQRELDDFEARIERQEELLARRRERLSAKFQALEQALAQLQSQSQLLSSQLLSIQQMGSGSGGLFG